MRRRTKGTAWTDASDWRTASAQAASTSPMKRRVRCMREGCTQRMLGKLSEERRKKLLEMKAAYVKETRVLICDSMPSIEFWFLIHYVNTRKYFKDSDAVIKVLRKFIPGYNKTGPFLEKKNWIAEMSSEEKQNEACKRAALLGPQDESYSEIYKAIALFAETVLNDN